MTATTRPARLLAVAFAASLTAAPACAFALAAAPFTVQVDPSVQATISADGAVLPTGPLKADPFTYTVDAIPACEAPFTDGARAVITQGSGDTARRTVITGVDPLEADLTAHIAVDATLADIVTPGPATLTVECIDFAAGIPQVGPTAIAQPITITDTEWQMQGVSVVEEPAPANPSPSSPSPSTSAPADPEPSATTTAGTETPVGTETPTGSETSTAGAPAGSVPGSDGGADTGSATGVADPGNGQGPASTNGQAGQNGQAAAHGQDGAHADDNAQGLFGALARTGTEVGGLVAAAVALMAGGAAFMVARRKRR